MTDKKIDVASGFMPDDFPYNNEIASSSRQWRNSSQ
jgi:hypothetical protein